MNINDPEFIVSAIKTLKYIYEHILKLEFDPNWIDKYTASVSMDGSMIVWRMK